MNESYKYCHFDALLLTRLARVVRAELTVGVLLVTELSMAGVSTRLAPGGGGATQAVVTLILVTTHAPDHWPPHPAGVNLGHGVNRGH